MKERQEYKCVHINRRAIYSSSDASFRCKPEIMSLKMKGSDVVRTLHLDVGLIG